MRNQLLYSITLFFLFGCVKLFQQPVSEMEETIVSVLKNRDLNHLIYGLFAYRTENKKWPSDRSDYATFISNTDSLMFRENNFKTLNWKESNDTLSLSLELQYAEGDATRYRYVNSTVNLIINKDTFHILSKETVEVTLK